MYVCISTIHMHKGKLGLTEFTLCSAEIALTVHYRPLKQGGKRMSSASSWPLTLPINCALQGTGEKRRDLHTWEESSGLSGTVVRGKNMQTRAVSLAALSMVRITQGPTWNPWVIFTNVPPLVTLLFLLFILSLICAVFFFLECEETKSDIQETILWKPCSQRWLVSLLASFPVVLLNTQRWCPFPRLEWTFLLSDLDEGQKWQPRSPCLFIGTMTIWDYHAQIHTEEAMWKEMCLYLYPT